MKIVKWIKKRFWKRVRMISLPNVVWWFLHIPHLLYYAIYCLIKKQSFSQRFHGLRVINELRKTTNYYSEKDNQNRATIKAYYKSNKTSLSVRVRFNKKASFNDYEKFRETMDTHANRCSNVVTEKGYAYFNVIKDFEPIYEYVCENTCVSVGTSVNGLVYWNWTKVPHMLAVGETGQGKSVFIKYVLNGLFLMPFEVWCVDGKVIDYSNSQHMFKYYVANETTNNKEIIDIVEKFRKYMMLRLEEMKKLDINEYYQSKDLKPKFLLIDEYLIIAEQMDKDERKAFINSIQDITLRGRACGYILILTMQRGDAKFIPGNIRDNFRFKIVVGNATDTSYKMMFDDSVIGFDVGRAWFSTGIDLDVLAIPYYKELVKNELKEDVKENTEDTSN